MKNVFNRKKNIMEKGFFKLARNVSLHSEHEKFRVGAVIVKKKPLSVGFNVLKTHPMYKDVPYVITIHAEIRALITCNADDITGADIYVYRQTKDGKPAMARPCDRCWDALMDAGIRNVYYSTKEYPYWRKERL